MTRQELIAKLTEAFLEAGFSNAESVAEEAASDALCMDGAPDLA